MTRWRKPIILFAILAFLLTCGTCVISPAMRCRAINGTIWIAARVIPRQIGWVHQILVPVFPDQAVLLVGDSLIGQLPPSWVDPQAINLGIGAIGVADVRTHLHELDALSSARTLVLLVGTNNLVGQSTLPSGLSLDIEQLLAALPRQISVIVCAVPPVDRRVHWERKADVIVDLNHTWKGLARARPNTRWVDLHHALIDSDGHLATAFHQGDGVHFSSAGNRVVAEAIRAAIAANGSNS